jgi:hypothetical protein
MLNGKTLVSAGYSGIVFVVLVLVGGFIAGAGPDTDAPAGEVREWLVDNRTALLWGAVIGVLATIPGLWFFTILAQAIRRATGDWVLSLAVVFGFVVVAINAWAANAAIGALMWRDGFVGTVSDDLVLYGWSAAFLLYAASSIGFVVFLGAAGWAIVRTRLAPVWLGWAGLVLALLGIVGVFGTLDAGSIGNVFLFLGFLGFSLWVVLAGVTMITGKFLPSAAPTDVPPTPAAAPPFQPV